MTLLESERPQLSPLFVDDLGRHGERVAALTSTGSITYAELEDRVAGLAERLGIERRLVLVRAANTVDALVAYVAALRGGHSVLLAPGDDASSGQVLIDAYDPDVVISAGQNRWNFDERRDRTVHDLHPELALLLSTSGSTGSPKLVRLSRRNLQSNAASIAEYLGLTPEDRAVTTLPMQYCYGLSVINSHLHAGASLVLTDLSVVDRCFWDLFRASGATSFAGVPHTFDLLDRVGFDEMSLPTLRYLTEAGGRMAPDKVRRYAQLGARHGWDLFVMYGQTEATARMAYLPPALTGSQPQSIGIPVPGGHFTIDSPDEDGAGELVYRGDNVMLGYAEQPRDLALGATVGALHTGDLARVSAAGLYEIVGRRSRFIKPYGIRIDLDRLERLLADDGVAGVCSGDDDLLIVAVEHPDQVDAATRLVAVHLGLPRSHVRGVCPPELPRLSNGKPDYAALRRHATDIGTPGTEPATPLLPPDDAGHQAALRAAFVDVLGVEPSDDDTFVALGGDSLSYVEMSVRLEQIIGSLPRDWHVTPVGHLAPTAATRRRLTVHTDTSVVLRAVAIVLIVGTHTKLWQLPGGAHALIAVAGYNFARFQIGASTMAASIARLAVPSMCWIAVVAAWNDKYSWANALLLNGFLGRPADHWGYWFIEAVVQILIPLALVLAVPAVARLERRRPFAVPIAAAGAGLLVRFDVIDLTSSHHISRPHEVFWIFALGWSAARATSFWHRLLVSAMAVAALPGFFANTHRELIVLAGLLLIVWVPTIPLPRLGYRVVAPVASASLYIYLTHFQVYPPLARLHGPTVALAGSVLVGMAAQLLTQRLTHRTVFSRGISRGSSVRERHPGRNASQS
ncbi:MAG TPA: AMP-binding protein [Acidimicrobiales bacterium]|nr:AMP-binding protein [Acidimicrobiales bacterium]